MATDTQTPDPRAGHYLVGSAIVDITPPVGVPLAGYAFRGVHSSTGVYLPLQATAIAIDDGQTRALLINIEWLGCYDRADRIRDHIAAATGLAPEHIILTATHTHCGPAIREADANRHGGIDRDYLARAIADIAEAAAAAWRQRSPASIGRGSGHCGLAMSRRRPDPDRPGRVLPGPHPNPDGPTDSEVAVLAVSGSEIDAPDIDGFRAVLVGYACHPTANNGLQIGGDYVGFTLAALRSRLPSAAVGFLQGCAGDQSPRPIGVDGRIGPSTPAAFPSRPISQVRLFGEELAAEAFGVLGEELTPVTGPIRFARSTIELETERGPGPVDVPRTIAFEIQTVSFGDSLALVALSAEPTVEHGLRLKRELARSFEQVIPVGYANAVIGYLPVARQYSELGYEVLDANLYHGRSGRFTESTEDRVHAEVHRLLRTR